MTNYKPGTVALATVHGVPNVRVFRDSDEGCVGWALGERVRNSVWASTDDVTYVRSLPVLHLDAYTEPASMLRSIADRFTFNAERSLLLNIADQIEEQTTPPRIPEPGLWGVVEAVLHGDEKRARLRYIRTAPATWLCVGGAQRSWNELVDPVLIREGVDQA